MTRKIEPLTASKALAQLQDNERGTHPAERLIIPVIPRDGTVGTIPHVEVQALVRGFDWENNCMVATPTQPLTVLTPEEVKDIQLSMRQGSNWHSYQRHQKQQEQIDLLTAQRDALMKAMEDSLCQLHSTTTPSSPESVNRAGAQQVVKSIVDNAKPSSPLPARRPYRQ